MTFGKIIEKAHAIPVSLSFLLVPVFYHPSFIYSFTQGKEILFKSMMVLAILAFIPVIMRKGVWKFKNIFGSVLLILLTSQILVYAVTDLLSSTPIVTLYGTYSRGFGFEIELFLFFLTVYIALSLSEEYIKILLGISFFSGLIIAFYAIMQRLGIDPFFYSYDIAIFGGRVFSFSGNPSYLGQLMTLDILIGFYMLFLNKSKVHMVAYGMGIIMLCLALLFSGTRTAILGILIAGILVSIKYYKLILNYMNAHKLIAVMACLIVILIAFVLPQERYSFSDIAMRSLNSRIEIWSGTMDLIKEKPLLGYGGETFYIYFPEIVTKEFLTLEENTNISADRVHNETLEIFFSHGIIAVLIYLAILTVAIWRFLKTKNPATIILSLLIVTNSIQNQFAFPDITINILMALCLGGLVALQSNKKPYCAVNMSRVKRYIFSAVLCLIVTYIFVHTVYRPYMSQLAYAESKENYSIDYVTAVEKHKEALYYTPYYSELWYELMFIDGSSMETALSYLSQIDGYSGNVLAWNGNFYASTDPQKSSEFFIMALEKNPYNPDWIRAFADMLYKNEDYEDALYFYNKWIESIPDFWQWTDDIEQYSVTQQKSYEIFFRNTPYFSDVVDRVDNIINILGGTGMTN